MQATIQHTRRDKGILLVAFGASLWGASGVAAQFLFHDKQFSPEWLVVARLLCAGVLLLAYDYGKNNGAIFSIWKNPADRKRLLLFGVFGMLSVQYTYFAAIQSSNAATATILQYLMPVVTVAYLSLRRRRWPTRRENISLVLAMLGAYLLVTKGDFHSLAISPPALFWGVAAAFSAAFYTIQPQELLHRWRSSLIIGWGMLIGGFAMSFINPPWRFSGVWDLPAFGGAAFVILFGTVIAFYSYLESTRYIQPSETGMIASLEPMAAVALSVGLLHIPFGFIDGLGGLCILSTIFILARGGK